MNRWTFIAARSFLGIGIVFGALFVVAALIQVGTDDSTSRQVDLERTKRIHSDIDGASLSWTGNASVTIKESSLYVASADAAPTILLWLSVVAVSWLLLIVVIDVQRGVPFEAKAARRLRTCAVLVAAAAIAHPLVAAWADTVVLDAADLRGPSFAEQAGNGFVNEGAPWLFAAALLASFAIAFSEGRRLADDTEGLV